MTTVTDHCDDSHKSLLLVLFYYCSHPPGGVKWVLTNVAPHPNQVKELRNRRIHFFVESL